jgi:phosphatidylserine/phosphatidylglycerophosphate/cardiolipin synthase-like enzyme
MMSQFEGDVVNSLYDAFLISWNKELEPTLPCLSTPAAANRDFHFGDRDAYIRNQSNQDSDSATLDDTHPHGSEHADDPTHELRNQSERYDKENHEKTTIPINERLNVSKKAEQTKFDNETDFAPFYFHTPHDPVPMALVNRQPQHLPGHHDLHNPQNAAWLQGTFSCDCTNVALKLAQKVVFIQSPVFNASPIVQAVLDTCKRGVEVILYVGLGFNDFAEGIVPFQGGTNDEVRGRMMEELTKENKQQYLKWHWYTAKDQKAPLRFEKQARNCHVKFFQVDGQVAIMGSSLL